MKRHLFSDIFRTIELETDPINIVDMIIWCTVIVSISFIWKWFMWVTHVVLYHHRWATKYGICGLSEAVILSRGTGGNGERRSR